MKKTLLDYKEILIYFDCEKNTLNPSDISLNCQQSVYWKCPKCNYEWHTKLSHLVYKKSHLLCPECNRKNKHLEYICDHETVSDNQILLNEWDYEMNKTINLYPETETLYSAKRAYWKCSQNHSYFSRIDGRARGRGCPYCSGKKVLKGFNDLVTENKEICQEWDYELNISIPENYTKGSNEKVYWKCRVCNTSYLMCINDRFGSRKSSCPVCNHKQVKSGINDLQTLFPTIANEFDEAKNKISVSKVFPYSNNKYWWKCPVCKKNYKMTPNSRTSLHQGCSYCAKRWQTSFPEQAILFYLTNIFTNVQNRYIYDGDEIDIFIPELNIGVEYNGIYFHKDKGEKDLEKLRRLTSKGIFMYIIKESENNEIIDNDSFVVINYIYKNSKYKTLSDVIEYIINDIFIKKDMFLNYSINLESDYEKILIYKKGVLEKSLLSEFPQIAAEWNNSKNSTSPQNHSAKSNDEVWWKCSVCHHEWKATISNRTHHGSTCPMCSKTRKINQRHQYTATRHGSIFQLYPNIVKNYSKQNLIDVNMMSPTSAKFAYWICENCNQEFNNHEVRTVISRLQKHKFVLCDKCAKLLKTKTSK